MWRSERQLRPGLFIAHPLSTHKAFIFIMEADMNAPRPVFSFPKPPAYAGASLPVATAKPAQVNSKDASTRLNVPFSVESAQKTRLESSKHQSVSQGIARRGPSESKPPATKETRQDIAGLEGFSHSHVSATALQASNAPAPVFSIANAKHKSTASNVSKASSMLFVTSDFNSLAVNRQQAPPPPTAFGANCSAQTQFLQNQKKITHPQKNSAFTRSSTPAQDTPQRYRAPASIDHDVVQSLFAAQEKRDLLLMEKVWKSAASLHVPLFQSVYTRAGNPLDVTIGGRTTRSYPRDE